MSDSSLQTEPNGQVPLLHPVTHEDAGVDVFLSGGVQRMQAVVCKIVPKIVKEEKEETRCTTPAPRRNFPATAESGAVHGRTPSMG